MTMDEIRAKLDEYDALGDDYGEAEVLKARTSWALSNPGPIILRKCFYCRKPMTPIQLEWDWVAAEVAAGREIEQIIIGTCDGCRGEDGDDG